jgi:hypothetical protein
VTLGRPSDAGEALLRRPGADVVVRGQAYHGGLLVGVSHVRSETYGPVAVASGQMVFTGVDFRWMRGGVQLRGEWLAGRPWSGTRTVGGYLDALVHRPFMGPVTLVTRVETLDYKDLVPSKACKATGAAIGQRHAQTRRAVRPCRDSYRRRAHLHDPLPEIAAAATGPPRPMAPPATT